MFLTDDLEHTSEVEITFTPDGDRRTRVTLVHRHLDRHGAGWPSLRNGLEGPDGWPLYVSRYETLTRGGSEGS